MFALVACNTLSFEDGLKLVSKRAKAMEDACKKYPGNMAAIIGLKDEVVEDVCSKINGVITTANFNCPGQIVISGEKKSIQKACKSLISIGAKRALILPVEGAFHSPLMDSAKEKLANEINRIVFKIPICPIYQNFSNNAETDPEKINVAVLNSFLNKKKTNKNNINTLV